MPRPKRKPGVELTTKERRVQPHVAVAPRAGVEPCVICGTPVNMFPGYYCYYVTPEKEGYAHKGCAYGR